MWILVALVVLLALLALRPAGASAPRAEYAYAPLHVAAVLTPAECDRLIAHATPRLERSRTLAGVSAVRTSEQAWIQPTDVDVGDLVERIRARTSQLVGTYREDLFEQLQVVRYVPGQEYRPHHDACVAECDVAQRIHRRATLLVYLTDDFEAGATYFPKIDARFKPKRGDAVLFYNADAGTGVLDASLHAGEPVLRGTKWVANCWVRYDA